MSFKLLALGNWYPAKTSCYCLTLTLIEAFLASRGLTTTLFAYHAPQSGYQAFTWWQPAFY